MDVLQELARRLGRAGVAVGDGVGDGHHDGGGRAVAADVGDEEAPAVIGQGEEVVVVAAGPARGLVGGGEAEVRDGGDVRGQQRALDCGDGVELAFDEGEGFAKFFLEDEVAGGAAEQVAHPDAVGQHLVVEGGRVSAASGRSS